MAKIKRKTLITIICSSVLVLACVSGIYLHFYSMRSSPNMMEGRSLEYYNVILSSKYSESNLKSLFDFEWDKAFIQENANEEPEYLNAKLGFDADLPKLDVWWGFPRRAVFISKNKVVFTFEYDKGYLDFADKEIFLYPDTIVKKEGEKPIVLHKK